MKLNGSYTFPIERDKLWAALMDPEIIGACVPGVQSFSAVAPDTYAFEVGFRVGIVSGAYKGTLEVRDIDAPNAYRMVVQGAGVRTDMRGEGNVALSSDDPTTTTLTFDGDVNVHRHPRPSRPTHDGHRSQAANRPPLPMPQR